MRKLRIVACFEFFCTGVYREGLKYTTNVPLGLPRSEPRF